MKTAVQKTKLIYHYLTDWVLRANWAEVFTRVLTYALSALFAMGAGGKLFRFGMYYSYMQESHIIRPGWLAAIVAVVLIGVELAVSALLAWPSSRKAGIIAGISLLPFHTYYVYFVLHWASFQPCSCLAVLPIGWEGHYWLNAIVLLVGVAALWLNMLSRKFKRK